MKRYWETQLNQISCELWKEFQKTLVCWWLTDTDGGEESGGDVRRQAVLEGRLQDVIGEGESDDGQRGRIHDEDSAP